MRFYVLLRGERFASRLGERRPSMEEWPRTFGFYTTRVVDAPDVERAVEQATAHVYRDERLCSLAVTGTGVVVPEQVHRVSWFYRRLFPPRGFTFVVGDTETA
jgi:hypothetical protein